MTDSPGLLLTLVAFAAMIAPLVFVHEMGHYLAARVFGIKAETFSIGFGREIAGRTDKRGTRWKLGWLPLGGYVKFAGDMNPASQPSADWLALPAEERNRTFQAKPLWQRAIVVAAGPVVNLLLAVVMLGGIAMVRGDPGAPPVAATIQAASPAAKAGLKPGDRITAVGGRPVRSFDQLAGLIQGLADRDVALTVVRDGEARTIAAHIGRQTVQGGDGRPLQLGLLGIGRPPVTLLRAPLVGAREVGEIVVMMGQGIGQIVAGDRSVDELGGPIRIAQVSGQGLEMGALPFLSLMALISINLGVINLLPIPILDGGHLFFYAIEAVRRRPVTPQVMDWAFRGGLAALLTLMLFVTLNDLGALGLWKGLAGLIG